MKKGLFLFLLTISISHTKGQTDNSAQYFEGYVDFRNEYKSLMIGVSDNDLKSIFGKFLRIYYKDGSFKWVFTDSVGTVKSYQMTIQKTHTEYLWYALTPDTVFTYDLSNPKRIRVDTIMEGTPDTVLGCTCQTAILSGSTYYEDSDTTYPAIYSYSFCPDLKVNPDHYKNFKNLRWDEVTKKYRSVAIKIHTVYGGYVSGTFTAIKIVREPVNMSEFAIDRSKIIKSTYTD